MADASEHHHQQQVVEQVVAAVTSPAAAAEEHQQEGGAGEGAGHYQPHPPHPPAELPPQVQQQQEEGQHHHQQQQERQAAEAAAASIIVEGVVPTTTAHHEGGAGGGVVVETTTTGGGEHHHHPTTPALGTTTTTEGSGKKDYEDGDGIGSNAVADKRRFFPRVKHLLTREWAYFLSGILDALDESGACLAASASHKASNAWYKAFDLVYGGIAVDCSIPTGKNRYHKFKDKIIELWVAMETQAPDDHPLKQRALNQVTAYRKACEEAELHFKNIEDAANYAPKTPGERKPKSYNTGSGGSNKRSYGSAMMSPGQGGPGGVNRWPFVDESEAIKKLPEQLQRLLHLRNLSTELKAESTVEITFQRELADYLKADCPREDAYDKSLALACLWRQAQSANEAKEIQTAYEHAVSEYLSYIDPSAATV